MNHFAVLEISYVQPLKSVLDFKLFIRDLIHRALSGGLITASPHNNASVPQTVRVRNTFVCALAVSTIVEL